MTDYIKVFCPKCNIQVMKIDGRSKIPKTGMCKMCRRMIVYDVENMSMVVKDPPQRGCSSGKIFL